MKRNYIVFKDKNSLLSCILLAFTAGLVMLGLSVVFSVNHDWQNWNNNDISFRTYELSNNLSQSEISKLENLNEVEKVVSPMEYSISATNVFLEDNPNSSLYILGLPDDELEKLLNDNFKNVNNKNYLICSNEFKPRNATIYYNNVDYIDLSNNVGQNIVLSFNNQNEELLLAGLYDNELFFNKNDICFSSFEVVKRLNDKYYNDESFANDKYRLIANKAINSNNVVSTLKDNGYVINNFKVKNVDIKDKILSYVFWLTIVIGLFSFFGTYLFIIKNIHNYRKDEIFMQGLTSYALAIVISFSGFLIIENYFLSQNYLFEHMDMTYSYLALFIGVLITFVTPIYSNICMKKNKKATK